MDNAIRRKSESAITQLWSFGAVFKLNMITPDDFQSLY
jgi:hypothetical protein